MTERVRMIVSGVAVKACAAGCDSALVKCAVTPKFGPKFPILTPPVTGSTVSTLKKGIRASHNGCGWTQRGLSRDKTWRSFVKISN